MGYYFWDKIKRKVYEDRLNTPFESEEEMISKKGWFGRNAPQPWLKFENLWKNFPAGSMQSKNAMGPPWKCTLDNILLHFFKTLFYYSFYNINNLQFLISLSMFYSSDFSFFSRTIFLTLASFSINMLKLSVVKL